MHVDGRCHCGEITWEADVEPGTVIVCHCNDCQQQTGSLFRTNVPARAGHFRILTGAPKTYLKIADSGARRINAFCGTCGAPVYATAEVDPKVYSLRIGGLAQRHELGAPERQIWTKRRVGWLPPLPSQREFEAGPT